MEQRQSGKIRTNMDAGPPFVRKRFSATETRISDTLLLTKAQTETLDAFYRTTLNGGVDLFDWTHPRTGSSVQIEIESDPVYRPQGAGLWAADIVFLIQP